MNLTKSQYQVRINPAENKILTELLESFTDEDKAHLIALDREGRAGYRNHSGRKPAPTSLLLRRALQIGLPLLAKELGK